MREFFPKICQIFSENKAKNFKFSPKIHKFSYFKKEFSGENSTKSKRKMKRNALPRKKRFATANQVSFVGNRAPRIWSFGFALEFVPKFQHFFKKMPKFKPLTPNFKAFL